MSEQLVGAIVLGAAVLWLILSEVRMSRRRRAYSSRYICEGCDYPGCR